jgi:hypothetical protein
MSLTRLETMAINLTKGIAALAGRTYFPALFAHSLLSLDDQRILLGPDNFDDLGRLKVATIPTVIATPFASTINIDASTGNVFEIGTLTGNVTLANPTKGANRQKIELIWKQNVTGGWTITLGNKIRILSISNVTSPINHSAFLAANKESKMVLEYNQAADKWDMVTFLPGY